MSRVATCADCGTNYPYLQKAHVVSKRKGGHRGRDNIVKICPNCHHLRDRAERVEYTTAAAQDPAIRERRSTKIKQWYATHPEENKARSERIAKSMVGNKNGLGNRGHSRSGWGNGLVACSGCGTTERPHKAQGMCNACYLRERRS